MQNFYHINWWRPSRRRRYLQREKCAEVFGLVSETLVPVPNWDQFNLQLSQRFCFDHLTPRIPLLLPPPTSISQPGEKQQKKKSQSDLINKLNTQSKMWPKNTGVDKQENWGRRLCSSTVSIPIFFCLPIFFNREQLLDGRHAGEVLVRVHHGPGLSLCFHYAVWTQWTWRRLVLEVEWSPVWHHPVRPGKHLIWDLREGFELWSLGLKQRNLGQTKALFPCLNQRDIDRQAWVIVLNSCPGRRI